MPGTAVGGRQLTGALIIEDDPLVADVLEGMLRELGVDQVAVAATLAEAAVHLGRHPVGLAIVDYQLGGRTAIAIAADLRRRGIPFLLCTGRSGSELPDELAGVPLLQKPFRDDALLAHLRALLGQRDRPGGA